MGTITLKVNDNKTEISKGKSVTVKVMSNDLIYIMGNALSGPNIGLDNSEMILGPIETDGLNITSFRVRFSEDYTSGKISAYSGWPEPTGATTDPEPPENLTQSTLLSITKNLGKTPILTDMQTNQTMDSFNEDDDYYYYKVTIGYLYKFEGMVIFNSENVISKEGYQTFEITGSNPKLITYQDPHGKY